MKIRTIRMKYCEQCHRVATSINLEVCEHCGGKLEGVK